MIKTDLNSFEGLGREAFPYPGALKGRPSEEVSAILIDPAGFFGEPDPETGHDPAPEGTRGFGWWPEIDQSPPLGIGEAHGAETLTVDIPGKRWLVTRSVVPAPEGAVDAYFEALEGELHNALEAGAREARHAVYNPDPTKLEIHRRKREMAEDIAINGATADVAKHDYLVEEAVLLGIGVVDLANIVLAKVAAIAASGKTIELAQKAAEITVTQSKGDEVAMRAAAVVDWSNLGGA